MRREQARNQLGTQGGRRVFSKGPKVFNPSQVTSKHKHRCCPCPKWADFVYSFILHQLTGLDAHAGFCTT